MFLINNVVPLKFLNVAYVLLHVEQYLLMIFMLGIFVQTQTSIFTTNESPFKQVIV